LTPAPRPLVTIGIPTYNRADYLQQALRSALDQTYPNLEIIVSDNCSTDATAAVVAGFADPRIRRFRQPTNIGGQNNVNFCLSQAWGAYFLLLHDDDLIDPDFVEVCIDAVSGDTRVGVIRTGTRVIDSLGRVRGQNFNRVGGRSTAEFFLGWFSGNTALYLCSTLYNRPALQDAGGLHSPRDLLDDVVATVRLAAQLGRADVYDVKASFRRHEGNSGSAVGIRDWCDDSLFLLDLMCQLAPDQQALIRRNGLRFLCAQNYSRASRTATNRLYAYFLVFSMFGYRHSPLAFFLSRYLRWARRHLQGGPPGMARTT
jgi:glycosyltransferase involved in cell wall biosynthesis